MANKTEIQRKDLIERYVASFEKLDDMSIIGNHDPVANELENGKTNQYGYCTWRPRRVDTGISLLDPLYSILPANFPPLFECLLTSFRWAEVDLGLYTLSANPPGPGLSGFQSEISRDKPLWSCLLQNRYTRFGKAPGGNYDPVCFDMRAPQESRDFPVVQIDHEQVLCYERVKVVSKLAPSFEELVLMTINQVEKS